MQYDEISTSYKNIGALERAVFYRIGFISHIKKYINYKKDGIYLKNLKYKDFLRYTLSFLCVKKKNNCMQIKIWKIKNKIEEGI